jgi:hypothetical protein
VNRSWSTKDELKFIDNIGTFGDRPLGRLDLLEGYVRGMRQRRDWSGMDRPEVLAHASAALDIARERRKLTTWLTDPDLKPPRELPQKKHKAELDA